MIRMYQVKKIQKTGGKPSTCKVVDKCACCDLVYDHGEKDGEQDKGKKGCVRACVRVRDLCVCVRTRA